MTLKSCEQERFREIVKFVQKLSKMQMRFLMKHMRENRSCHNDIIFLDDEVICSFGEFASAVVLKNEVHDEEENAT